MRPIPFLFVTLYKLILHEKPRFHIPHAPVVRIVPFVLYTHGITRPHPFRLPLRFPQEKSPPFIKTAKA